MNTTNRIDSRIYGYQELMGQLTAEMKNAEPKKANAISKRIDTIGRRVQKLASERIEAKFPGISAVNIPAMSDAEYLALFKVNGGVKSERT